ncbi:DoxX family protein [Rhizobium rhizogenes]|uniref:DoxX family protein n=1 Tax=Rhizobium rhizogenes TaxID=359 RepID=UPI00157343AD|nr:DoxX family protein [Rhizobium rhizogenes]NTF44109.1 hypothetical protein [Rhizobium rhizogenes]
MAIENRSHSPFEGRWRWLSRVILSCLYAMAGILHLTVPAPFLTIMPEWVPHPQIVVAITGVYEVVGAVGLLMPRLRRSAGWLLAIYAICVFPANIKHAIIDLTSVTGGLGPWYHFPRLLLQPVIVWWALYASEILSWPCAKQSRRTSVLDAE